jgi:hypothetical protein
MRGALAARAHAEIRYEERAQDSGKVPRWNEREKRGGGRWQLSATSESGLQELRGQCTNHGSCGGAGRKKAAPPLAAGVILSRWPSRFGVASPKAGGRSGGSLLP